MVEEFYSYTENTLQKYDKENKTKQNKTKENYVQRTTKYNRPISRVVIGQEVYYTDLDLYNLPGTV